MIRRSAFAPIALLLAACAAPAPPRAATPPPRAVAPAPAAPPAPTTEKLIADAPRATAEGTTFTAPGGWTLRSEGAKRLLDGPVPDLRVAVVDVGVADSAEAAVAEAWPALVRDFKRPIKSATDLVPRHGWDQQRGFWYETALTERLVVRAHAFRKGQKWTVVLVSASEISLGNRVAQAMLAVDSLRPAGYTGELFLGKTAYAPDAPRVQALKDFVDAARIEAGIPGVAVSLFTTDAVIFEGGFGVRELGNSAPVTADTLFMIASNTKALSMLLLATLVDEGKLAWNRKVTSVYPAFKLADAGTTSRVEMKHLLCMCTGFPREEDVDWLFAYKSSSPKGIFDVVGTTTLTSGFAEFFQYTDLLPAAAGFIGGALLYPKLELGAAYDEAMRTRVFGPLGMTSTTFDFAEALRKDHASPHSEDATGNPAIAEIEIDRALITPVRSAGGAWSSVKDMRRFVQMELAKGWLPDSKRFLSAAALRAGLIPQIATKPLETYGMGLMLNVELGIVYVHHGGNVVGFKSDFFWLPMQGVGGVILTNADSGGILRRAFLRRTLEVLFDGNPEAAKDATLAVAQRKASLAKARAGRVLPADPAIVAKLAARYTNPTLGELVVHTDARGTVFDFGAWKSTVASRKHDDGTTALATVDPGVSGYDFVVADRGSVRRLVLRDPQHEHVFTEAGPPKAATPP